MSNPWSVFERLLPKKSRWVGKVENIIAGGTMVSLPIGVEGINQPTIFVKSSGSYEVGDYVFIEGDLVTSQAPDIREAFREIIY